MEETLRVSTIDEFIDEFDYENDELTDDESDAVWENNREYFREEADEETLSWIGEDGIKEAADKALDAAYKAKSAGKTPKEVWTIWQEAYDKEVERKKSFIDPPGTWEAECESINRWINAGGWHTAYGLPY